MVIPSLPKVATVVLSHAFPETQRVWEARVRAVLSVQFHRTMRGMCLVFSQPLVFANFKHK